MCDHCGCREFAPIAELTADHERILALAWQAVEGDPRDEGWQRAKADLVQLLDVHAAKEELGLYPLLIDTRDLGTERCDRLEAEHRDVHDLLEAQRFDRRGYYALAAHIEEEEMELFSGAMFAFDDDQWEAMERAHHEALHRLGVAHHHA